MHYTHTNETLWQQHLAGHLEWIEHHVAAGHLLASGPGIDTEVREGNLIFKADNRAQLDSFLTSDPYVSAGAVDELTVRAFDPIFGLWNAESSFAGATAEQVITAVQQADLAAAQAPTDGHEN